MTFSKEQIDAMVRDACRLEKAGGIHSTPYVLDVCCHVKALAAELERLQAMERVDDDAMNQAAREWLVARDAIATFFVDLLGPRMNAPDPDFPDQTLAQHNAAAILARLASHKPPILLHMEGP